MAIEYEDRVNDFFRVDFLLYSLVFHKAASIEP